MNHRIARVLIGTVSGRSGSEPGTPRKVPNRLVKMRRGIASIFLAIFLGQIQGSDIAFAIDKEEQDPPRSSQREPPRYMTTRIYARLTPSTAKLMNQILGDREYITTDEIPIDALRQFGKTYQVLRWDSAGEALPESEDVIGLRQMYTLTCNLGIDIRAAANALKGYPDLVEYAVSTEAEVAERLQKQLQGMAQAGNK